MISVSKDSWIDVRSKPTARRASKSSWIFQKLHDEDGEGIQAFDELRDSAFVGWRRAWSRES